MPIPAGASVTITGLTSRADLNGQSGVAESLARSGRYIVVVEGAGSFKLKPTNLIIKNHKESVHGDMLVVNGMSYCSAHRLEICGSCCYQFRLQNRLAALGGSLATEEEAFEVAKALDKEEAEQNLPPVKAPRVGEPVSNREPPKARLSKKELVPTGLDPSALPLWGPRDGDVKAAFHLTFSQRELIMMSQTNDVPAEMRSPLYGLRRALHDAAIACQRRVVDPSCKMPRFIMQDDAQSEAISFDLVAVNKIIPTSTEVDKATGSPKKPTPLLTVRWVYGTAGNAAKSIKVFLASLSAGEIAGFVSFDVTVDELRTLKQLLEQNAERLDPGFLQAAAVAHGPLTEGWGISTLQPVSTEFKKTGEGRVCAACGKKGAKNVCSRCTLVHYCSRECQTKHWPDHKKAGCAKATPKGDAPASTGLVTVDMQAASSKPPPGMVAFSISFNSSLSGQRAPTEDPPDPSKAHKDGKIFIIKVQVPMGGTTVEIMNPRQPMSGMMLYCEKRKLSSVINAGNCAEAEWRRLDEVIRKGPMMGGFKGMKGYFKAFLEKGKLKIMANDPLPQQPW